MSDSPAITPELTATTYRSDIRGNLRSKNNAAKAPMNMDRELKNGMTIAKPSPVAEGM
jgi:hypothetical protein